MMKTSRQQILDFIRAQRAVSVSDLSRALQMTEANARHHLKILVEMGLVVVVGQRPKQGKGRPVRLFGLSELAVGSSMDRLAGALLVSLVENAANQPLEQTLSRLVEHLLASSPGQGDEIEPGAGRTFAQSPHLAQRLYMAVRRLNEFHYEARWEAHSIAPRLILGRCPYASLVDEHRELCSMDLLLIEHLSGVDAQQIAQRQPDRRGLRQCIFVLRKFNR